MNVNEVMANVALRNLVGASRTRCVDGIVKSGPRADDVFAPVRRR